MLNTTESTTLNLIRRLDQTLVNRYRESLEIEDQIASLQAKQDELDKEVEEAFTLRNGLVDMIGQDEAYDDLPSFM
ncbi:hypothetical protein [Pseudodesulfovibrio senegalensis]|uniref:Uncharacterized protein n=1 Tax=Pseudodesulfovibrio senegalensis TaxID=1721087 RepID=A0A6N6N6U0_9BACT|nr:hypothetical protein [Pseudodesulfovibrio senegalensis]KAB1443746.1 hypothetical protein F8A88_05790 [Pseudodesulfovibrio senegalensis]